MTTSTQARYDIEVLEPLLLMSASAIDCDAADFVDAEVQNAAEANGEGLGLDVQPEQEVASLIAVNDCGEDGPVRCRGLRADFAVEDQGFGIYAIKNGPEVNFVVDIDEIEFEDGVFPIAELVGGPPEFSDSVETPVPVEEIPVAYGSIDPIELPADDAPVEALPNVFAVSEPLEIVESEVVEAEQADEVEIPVRSDDSGLIPRQTFEWQADDVVTLTEDVWFADDAVVAEECAIVEPVPVPNEGPAAQDDTNSTLQDQAVSGTCAVNDSDADGDSLTFWIERGPENGSIEFAEDGSYVYTPDPGFCGQDTFTYEVADGNGGTATAEVCITVDPIPVVNEGPVAQDDTNSTLQDQAVSGSVAANDSDADGDSLTFWIERGPENGSIEFAEDGSYVYTPDPGFCGQDTFTYEVVDGNGGCAVAEVCITVDPIPNQGPVAQDDASETLQDVSVSGSVAANDSDADGDDLTFYVEEGPENGSIEFAEDGTFVYTPDPGYSGQDSFTYEANDGNGGIDIATVTIAVAPNPNEGPIAEHDFCVTECGTPVSGNVLTNDSDIDGDCLTVTLQGTAGNGTVTLEADGTFTYVPNPDFVGQDTFCYEVTDGNGGCAVAEVCIEVLPPVNQGPDAQDDFDQTSFETPREGSVLSNDSDPDGDELSTALVTSTTNGTISLDANGDYTYTPNEGFVGQDSFVYELTDGKGGCDTAEVTIDVAPPVNEAPEAVKDDYITWQDEAVEGNVLDNDVDPEGDILTASPMTDIQTTEGGIVTLHEDGSFVYVPAEGFCGVDSFTYTMHDGDCNSATATVCITVSQMPDVPQDDVFSGDAGDQIKGDVILNDAITGADSTVELLNGPVNGTLTLNDDGTFCYSAEDGFSGEDTFTYVIKDPCGVSEEAVVRLVVAEVFYDTTYESSGNGRIWGDPHFEGDDGGLYDVQGEAGHIYSLLSDKDLQINALYIPWEAHPGSTMLGEIGATVGTDLVHADLVGTRVNGDWLDVGEVRAVDGGTVEYDGEFTYLTTDAYNLRFHRRDGWMDMKLEAIDPFSDNVAAHGLWGQTVDGDTEARSGDFFKDDWNYALQGGGALDTVDEDGNVVRSQRGDDTAFRLYEVANLFSTMALNDDGDSFFRFNALQGTGLTRIS